MKGVGGGHQPVNLTPTANENKAQDANKVEGGFGRFKVSLPKMVKQFFSSLFSAKPRNTSVHSRDTSLSNPIAQKPASNAEKSNSSQRVRGQFDQALQQAESNPNARQCFSKVSETLETLQNLKSDLRNLSRGTESFRICSLEIQLIKAEYKEAVISFNSSVGSVLKLDSGDLEMAMLNKDTPGNLDIDGDAENYKQYEKMKDALL